MTTGAPLSPIRLGNKVFPNINSSNIEELRNELEKELDIILKNLYELSQPWDTLLATCGASQETMPSQQPGAGPSKHPHGFAPRGTLPKTRLPHAQAQAAFTTAANQQLPSGPRPTGFMPNMHAKPETPRKNMSEFNAHLGAFTYGQSESNQYMPRYSMPSGAGASLHSSLISSNSATGGFASSDARANLGVPSAEQAAHGATFSSTLSRSRSCTANLSGAYHKTSTRICPPNCTAEASFVPNSNALKKVKQSSLTSSLQHTPVYATKMPSAGCSTVSNMEAAHTVSPAGLRKNHMPQAHTSQPRTFEFTNTQPYGFPHKILHHNRSPANNARGSTPDASTSEALSKTSSNISGKPHSVFHSNATNESAVSEPSPPGPSPAGTNTSSKSLPNLLQSTSLPASTSLPGSSVCATTASDTLLNDTTLTATTPKNSTPPTLPASVGNLNFGTIPWNNPRPSSRSSHETLPRPPAWHQRGPVPWGTQGARAGPLNCPLPGHVAPVRVPQPATTLDCTLVSPHLNCSVAVHVPPVRASPSSAYRPSTSTLASPQLKGSLVGHAAAVRVSSQSVNRPPALANPQMRLGPGPVPRQPWHTSSPWTPSWPAHARWPVSSWPPLASENRNPSEPVSRPLARPMHGSALSPATWPPLRAGSPVVRQPITQPTSVCGIIPSPSFGQVAKLPAHRPPVTTGTAGTSTPQTPIIDSLLGARPRLPPPASSVSTSSPCSTAPQPNVKSALTNATSSASDTSTTSTSLSPSTAPPEPTAVHVTSNAVAPISRYSAVPAPRHANKIAQGRCFKAPVAPGTKAALLNPGPRLPPRLASKLATRPPATPSCISNSNSSKLCPEADKPVNQPCKDTQVVPEAAGQQPANSDPKECDVKTETKTEDCKENTKGEQVTSPCTAPSVGPCSAWRKAPNIKGLAGASGHNSQDVTSKQNETAPAPPEKNRQENVAVSAAPPHPTSGRRRKRR